MVIKFVQIMRYIFFARIAGLTIAATLCLNAALAQPDEVMMDSALAHLSDVRVISKTVNYSPYRLEYQLAIRQPVDHSNLARGSFYQQLHLIHRGLSRPMVMETQGYEGR